MGETMTKAALREAIDELKLTAIEETWNNAVTQTKRSKARRQAERTVDELINSLPIPETDTTNAASGRGEET